MLNGNVKNRSDLTNWLEYRMFRWIFSSFVRTSKNLYNGDDDVVTGAVNAPAARR